MTESDLAERLQHLETLLAERSAPVIGHLRPRATADEITATLTDAGVFSHPDLTTWFGWHDGTDTPSAHTPPGLLPPGPENRLIGPWHLLSLDQALAEHERFQQVEQETPIGLYPPGWFPVLRWVDNPLACLDTTGTSGPPGTLYISDPNTGIDPDGPSPWYPSLLALTDAVIAAYERGHVKPGELVLSREDLPGEARPLDY